MNNQQLLNILSKLNNAQLEEVKNCTGLDTAYWPSERAAAHKVTVLLDHSRQAPLQELRLLKCLNKKYPEVVASELSLTVPIHTVNLTPRRDFRPLQSGVLQLSTFLIVLCTFISLQATPLKVVDSTPETVPTQPELKNSKTEVSIQPSVQHKSTGEKKTQSKKSRWKWKKPAKSRHTPAKLGNKTPVGIVDAEPTAENARLSNSTRTKHHSPTKTNNNSSKIIQTQNTPQNPKHKPLSEAKENQAPTLKENPKRTLDSAPKENPSVANEPELVTASPQSAEKTPKPKPEEKNHSTDPDAISNSESNLEIRQKHVPQNTPKENPSVANEPELVTAPPQSAEKAPEPKPEEKNHSTDPGAISNGEANLAVGPKSVPEQESASESKNAVDQSAPETPNEKSPPKFPNAQPLKQQKIEFQETRE